MNKWQRLFQILVAGVLLVAVCGGPPLTPPAIAGEAGGGAADAGAVGGGAQPALLEMAAAQPGSRLAVIVQKAGTSGDVEGLVKALGGTVTRDLRIINAFAAELPGWAVSAVAQAAGVRWVSWDAPMVKSGGPIDTGSLQSAFIQTVGADRVWNEGPAYLQGQGVGVAVVDSGNCQNNGEPCDSVTDASGQSHVVAAVSVMTDNGGNPYDFFGHGSLIEGIVGGTGLGSAGRYFGVAPGVNLVSVRVADNLGMATSSDVVAGLQWVLDHKAAYNIRVVNLSLNSSAAESYDTNPLSAACEILWFNGIVVVVSAGNNGTATLYPPANDPFVITVGATDDQGTADLNDDIVASFSAYGITEAGLAKPDLVAPGADLISIVPKTKNKIYKDHAAHRTGESAAKEYYMHVSGTSFAAPVVAGAAALVLQNEPNLTPDQVKYRLMTTASKRWAAYSRQTAGAGILDVYAAVHGTSIQTSNTGLAASKLLWTGATPVAWDSVNWNSVNWNAVNWNAVNWNSDYWGH